MALKTSLGKARAGVRRLSRKEKQEEDVDGVRAARSESAHSSRSDGSDRSRSRRSRVVAGMLAKRVGLDDPEGGDGLQGGEQQHPWMKQWVDRVTKLQEIAHLDGQRLPPRRRNPGAVVSNVVRRSRSASASVARRYGGRNATASSTAKARHAAGAHPVPAADLDAELHAKVADHSAAFFREGLHNTLPTAVALGKGTKPSGKASMSASMKKTMLGVGAVLVLLLLASLVLRRKHSS